MGKNVARGLFWITTVGLLFYSGYLTWDFSRMVFPDSWFEPILALVVFDFGMLAWLQLFRHDADGSWQRVICIGMTVFDFVGMALTSIADIWMGGQKLVTVPADMAANMLWVYAIWVSVNVLGGIVHFLTQPDAMREIAIGLERDAVVDLAMTKLRGMRTANAASLADALAAAMMGDVERGIERLRQAISAPGTGISGVPVSLPVPLPVPPRRVASPAARPVSGGNGAGDPTPPPPGG